MWLIIFYCHLIQSWFLFNRFLSRFYFRSLPILSHAVFRINLSIIGTKIHAFDSLSLSVAILAFVIEIESSWIIAVRRQIATFNWLDHAPRTAQFTIEFHHLHLNRIHSRELSSRMIHSKHSDWIAEECYPNWLKNRSILTAVSYHSIILLIYHSSPLKRLIAEVESTLFALFVSTAICLIFEELFKNPLFHVMSLEFHQTAVLTCHNSIKMLFWRQKQLFINRWTFQIWKVGEKSF